MSSQSINSCVFCRLQQTTDFRDSDLTTVYRAAYLRDLNRLRAKGLLKLTGEFAALNDDVAWNEIAKPSWTEIMASSSRPKWYGRPT